MEITNDETLQEPKTLKVTIPTKLHLQLHQLKLLSGQTISDTVEEAVSRHLDGLDGADLSL